MCNPNNGTTLRAALGLIWRPMKEKHPLTLRMARPSTDMLLVFFFFFDRVQLQYFYDYEYDYLKCICSLDLVH